MDILNVYNIKTDIEKSENIYLEVNIIGTSLSDAVDDASRLTYNGVKLQNHIITAERIIDEAYQYCYNATDLNPDYKPKEDKEDK